MNCTLIESSLWKSKKSLGKFEIELITNMFAVFTLQFYRMITTKTSKEVAFERKTNRFTKSIDSSFRRSIALVIDQLSIEQKHLTFVYMHVTRTLQKQLNKLHFE